MLHKIRQACAGSDPVELPAEMPDFPHYSDPVEKFHQELERAGGVFLDGRSSEGLAGALGLVLKESDSTEIYWEGEKAPHILQNLESNPTENWQYGHFSSEECNFEGSSKYFL